MTSSQFLHEYFAPSDLQTFFGKYYTSAKGRSPQVVGVNNASHPGDEGASGSGWGWGDDPGSAPDPGYVVPPAPSVTAQRH